MTPDFWPWPHSSVVKKKSRLTTLKNRTSKIGVLESIDMEAPGWTYYAWRWSNYAQRWSYYTLKRLPPNSWPRIGGAPYNPPTRRLFPVTVSTINLPCWHCFPRGDNNYSTMIQFNDNYDDEGKEGIVCPSFELIIEVARLVMNKRHHIEQALADAHVRTAPLVSCIRCSVEDIYSGMGPKYFQCANWMEYDSFWNLHNKLAMGTEEARLMSRGYEKRGGRDGGLYLLPPITNGPITSSVQFACALCYFAGISSLDIMAKYCISHLEVMESVWYTVELVNLLD